MNKSCNMEFTLKVFKVELVLRKRKQNADLNSMINIHQLFLILTTLKFTWYPCWMTAETLTNWSYFFFDTIFYRSRFSGNSVRLFPQWLNVFFPNATGRSIFPVNVKVVSFWALLGFLKHLCSFSDYFMFRKPPSFENFREKGPKF